MHIRLTSERPSPERDHACRATREHRQAFPPLGVATRDLDRLGKRGECLVAMEPGFVVAPHFLVAVQAFLVARGEGDGPFVELHGPRCRKPASRHPSRCDQGSESLPPDLLASPRV